MQRTLFTTLMATSFMAVSLKYIMPREIEKVRSAHDTASVCVCVGGEEARDTTSVCCGEMQLHLFYLQQLLIK